jgi:hypothetical protein
VGKPLGKSKRQWKYIVSSGDGMLIAQGHYCHILGFILVFVFVQVLLQLIGPYAARKTMTEVSLRLVLSVRELFSIETIFSCLRTSLQFFQIRYIWEDFMETALE